MKTFAAILVLGLLAQCSLAQCSGGRCFLPRRQVSVPVQRPANAKPEYIQEVLKAQKENFGVDQDKLSGEDEYSVHDRNGCRNISKSEAHKIVGQKLQDDSNKLRITVIGEDGTQKRVTADIRGLMKDIDNWAILRGYPPNHWSLEPGFVTTGSPTIYCQAPSGKVLHRQDDYQGGGEELSEALRKAKSGYDSKKDPDLRKTQLPPPVTVNPLQYGLAAVVGAGVMLYSKRRKQ